MIKNDRQFRILKARQERLRALLVDIEVPETSATDDDSKWARLQHAAVAGEVERLQRELEDYEALKSGQAPVGGAVTLDDVARLLIRARIARGMTQAQLAERLGLKEQQIQRYEASDYESASLGRIRAIARELRVELHPPGEALDVTTAKTFISGLEASGIDRAFIQTRIAPELSTLQDAAPASFLKIAARIERIFGGEGGLGTSTRMPSTKPAAVAAFKTSRAAKLDRLQAYARYAHYLATRTLAATAHLPRSALPSTPEEVRASIRVHGDMNFSNAALMCWMCGVPVLPLADGGAFHAAYWRHDGRSVIVLKQTRRFPALWLFDLLHEFRHAIDRPDLTEREAVERDPTDPARVDSPEEAAANDFAGRVIFGGDPSHLFELTWEKSRGQIGLVKRAVSLVARKEGVDEEALAYYVAFRLKERGFDWWASATSMQTSSQDPWEMARALYLERVRLDDLDPVDQDLVLRALTEPNAGPLAPPGEG